MTPDERRRVIDYARRAVAHAVRTRRPDPSPPSDGPFALPGAAFVTLKKRADGDLRGCIGHLLPEVSLGEELASVAVSAFPRRPSMATPEPIRSPGDVRVFPS